VRKELGRYFIDLSKLVFGGAVLSSILQIEEVSRGSILLAGIAATIIIGGFGFVLIRENKDS